MSEHIVLSAADGQFTAYVARPCTRQAAVIIVLQEIFGVNADIRGMCDEMAEHGFIAIAPDLFGENSRDWTSTRGARPNGRRPWQSTNHTTWTRVSVMSGPPSMLVVFCKALQARLE